jgi:hypothetical protein
MKRCYILHIPSGEYLKDCDGNNDIYKSIKQATTQIKCILALSKLNYLGWNEHNKHIGTVVAINEFEIIRLED